MDQANPATSPQSSRRRLAFFEALLVTIIWSSTFVVVKLGLESLGPLTIAGLRYFLGSLILVPIMIIRKGSAKPISKQLWIKIILIGVSSYTIGNGALFWGLKYIPATTGSFLMGLIPLLALVGGILFLKEFPTRWQLLGVFITLFGSGLFFSSGLLPGETRGVIILSIGLIGFVVFSILGRSVARVRELDTLRLTMLPLLIGGSITLILAFFIEGLPDFTWNGLLVVVYLAIVNTSLGYLIYNHALKELTAFEMNMVMNLTPLFTALLGWLILGEVISFLQVIGMLTMIFGVILVQQGNFKEGDKQDE
jgi:drug/metabolite transporter (DMT)-like permease